MGLFIFFYICVCVCSCEITYNISSLLCKKTKKGITPHGLDGDPGGLTSPDRALKFSVRADAPIPRVRDAVLSGLGAPGGSG